MKRHVLLAVIGLSPQVITEAVYALFLQGKPVHAIHCITTNAGAGEIFRTLLAPQGGPLDDFCRQYGIDRGGIDFGHHSVRVLCRKNGDPMEDIETEEDNEIVLQTCLELAHGFTADPDTVVSFLVAGGRKTMTSCLTLAAQCYGRPCDRIYHVLVSPEFENCRGFWFPPRESVQLRLVDHRGEVFYKETRYARISLIPIPFVSIRGRLVPEMLDQPRPPADLLDSLVRSGPRVLRIDLENGTVSFGNDDENAPQVDFSPAPLALYAFFAEQKLRCERPHSCAGCTDCWLEPDELERAPRLAELYRAIPSTRHMEIVPSTSIVKLDAEGFRSYRSKINRSLKNGFGNTSAHELEITPAGRRPNTRYGLPIDKERIDILWP